MNDAVADAAPVTPAPAESATPGSTPAAPKAEGLLANATPGPGAPNPSPADPAQPAPASVDPAATPGPGEIAGRPDYIAEQFWNTESGKPKVEELSKSYNELRNQNNKLMQEKGQSAPEKAEDYLKDYVPPHRSRPSGDQKEGDIMSRYGDLDAGDPVFVAISKFAKNGNMSKGNFDDGMQTLLQDLHEVLPEPLDEAKEMAILGESGKVMVETNRDWADTLMRNGVINEAEFNQLLSLGGSAIGVQLMNKMRLNSGEKPIPLSLDSGQDNGRKTPDECAALQAVETSPGSGQLLKDENTPAGQAHRDKITAAYSETYGTKEV